MCHSGTLPDELVVDIGIVLIANFFNDRGTFFGISCAFVGLLFEMLQSLCYTKIYFRVAQGLQHLKQQANKGTTDPKESTTVIEKIGDQYYTYIDDEFIGQGPTMTHATDLVQDVIVKNPNRFGVMKVIVKE